MKCRRKHAEEKDDDDKPQEKPKKKDRRESELEAGPSRKKGSKELEESRTTGQDSELQTLLRRLLARFDPQTISWRSSWSWRRRSCTGSQWTSRGREEEAAVKLSEVAEEKEVVEEVEVTVEGVENTGAEVDETME